MDLNGFSMVGDVLGELTYCNFNSGFGKTGYFSSYYFIARIHTSQMYEYLKVLTSPKAARFCSVPVVDKVMSQHLNFLLLPVHFIEEGVPPGHSITIWIQKQLTWL